MIVVSYSAIRFLFFLAKAIAVAVISSSVMHPEYQTSSKTYTVACIRCGLMRHV